MRFTAPPGVFIVVFIRARKKVESAIVINKFMLLRAKTEIYDSNWERVCRIKIF